MPEKKWGQKHLAPMSTKDNSVATIAQPRTLVLQQLQDGVRRVLCHWLWGDVNAGDDDKEGDLQRQAEPKVLLRHPLDAVVGGDDDAGVIRHRAGHS